jgi:hypothetical protein
MEALPAATFAIDALAKFGNVNIPDKILREVEGIIMLLVTLTQQTTAMGAISAIMLWAQGRISGSMLGKLKNYLAEILKSPQSDATPDWILCLRDLRQNWRLCKNNRAFNQVSKLLGCLVMLGMCDISKLTFHIGQFKVFAPTINEKHTNAFDLADAIFETVLFFTEGAYLCFKTGSIKPLLVNDTSAMELDQEFAQVSAWFDLVKNGNLQKFTDMTDQEFEKRMNALSTNLKNVAQSLTGLDRKLVMDKFQKILAMQNNYVTMKVSSGMRHAPFGIELFGKSSQGKTSLGNQLLDALLASQGMPTGKEFRCAYNAGDKYISNWVTDMLVMIFDDIANDKSKFVERPPTRAILDVINNQMYYAPKAEIEAKGKCFVEPWIAMATTNKKDLDAGMYSNCPYSIQRRMVVITVTAKDEFLKDPKNKKGGIDSTKVRKFHTNDDGEYEPPPFDDIWTLSIEEAVEPEDLSMVAQYAPIEWRGRIMKDINMETCIQWAIEAFNDHRLNQENVLKRMKERRKFTICSHPGCHQLEKHCPDHQEHFIGPLPEKDPDCRFETQSGYESAAKIRETWEKTLSPQFGAETVKAIRRIGYKAMIHDSMINRFYDKADKDFAKLLYGRVSSFLDSWEWIKILPSQAFHTKYSYSIYKWLYKDQILESYETELLRLRLTWITSILTSLITMNIPFIVIFSIISTFMYLSGCRNLYEKVEKDGFIALSEANMEVAPIVRKYRDNYAKYICGAFIGVAALYGLARAYKAYVASVGDPQGSLEPENEQDVQERDNEGNVWTQVVKRDLPITEYSKRMSPDQLSNVVEKALVYGTVSRPEGNGMVNGLMLSSNVILIPNHYFTEFGDSLDCTFRKKNPEASGGKFAARLHTSASYLIPDTDLRVCYTATGGSYKNLVNFFPVDDMPSVPFKMHWRKKNGELIHARGMTQPCIVETVSKFNGGQYKNLSINTFDGLCGATLVSETNGSVIVGIHLGGTSGTPVGCYGSLTQQQLWKAFQELRKIEGVVLSGEAGKFETKVLGVQLLKEDGLHKKSPLNYLPPNSQIEYLGSCIGRSVSKSAVRVTPISEHVTDVCGVPNIYRGPKMHPEWYGWQTCLSNLAVPATPFPHDLLQAAVKDYKEPLIDVFQKPMWSKTRPLTDKENLCGVPGAKFMDAIKLNTSVGFPLTGPKRDHVTELEPTEEFPNNRELSEELMDEIKRLEDCYRRGERAYPIAKACKKDEILSKEKCRIFYGNALSLTWLIRKYFLPILRVLQMNPLVAECAVGINSHGPEWEEFYKFVTKHGLKRLIGGDYGKYDQKLSSQLIFAALRILIDFAKECDYSEEDIRIMEAMTGDIVFAYIAFNGDLIGLTEGTHISGNSLTVIINGICGSLNMRCFFYTMYPFVDFDKRDKFRDCVAAMTYGDDNIGSVKEGYEKFTIKGFSRFLAEYGQVYTMPDKESELLDYLPAEQFEFLKRTSVYHPKLGMHVGALVDKSIYKSLHCFMREKNCPLTQEHAAALNIDTALREWFNHGEDKYETQRRLMQQVANRANISHMCTGLHTSYSERVAEWMEQYGQKPSRSM